MLSLALFGCSQAAPAADNSSQPAASQSTGAQQPADQESAKPAEDAKISGRIGLSPPDITGVFKTATDYMEAAAKDARDHGIDVQVVTRSNTSHTDAASQIESIENFIQDKMDVIIISPAEVEAVKPAIRAANDAGIPVILVNMLEKQDGIEVASYIGFDNAQAASVSAYSMLDALGGPGVLGEGETAKLPEDGMLDLEWWEGVYANVDRNSISGNVAIIEGIAGDMFSNQRNEGFHAVVDQFPGIKVLTTIAADWNRQKGIEAAENILQNFPELDAIFASSNEMGIGAYNAVKDAGRENEVIIVTNDGTVESVDMIRKGQLTAETWHGFPDWGWYGVKFAVMLAYGKQIPEQYDIMPRTEYVGNADDFYPNPKLEPIDCEAIING
ncbi:MAG: sugar ABC transporter substrate-binding protein [Christensenellaceae bacterium]|nr:sugar ABC transporter substrate-binding protein [Christensenellaceae bacterium]